MKDKILYVFRLITELESIPVTYFKHLADTDGLYEIRVQQGNNIIRIFCFFDHGNVIVIGNGFFKKTERTPIAELAKAQKIRKEYFYEKEIDNS